MTSNEYFLAVSCAGTENRTCNNQQRQTKTENKVECCTV